MNYFIVVTINGMVRRPNLTTLRYFLTIMDSTSSGLFEYMDTSEMLRSENLKILSVLFLAA